MFAFVIWDKLEKKIFGARDRMGVKPFYYYDKDKSFTFASRPNPIINLNPNLKNNYSLKSIQLYLHSGYVPAPYSIYDSISQLKPGHYILWDYDNGLKINEWWSTNNYFDIQDYNILDESKIIDELDSLLLDSVEKWVISDVPVGVFLSGGLDSSLIAAMSSKIRNKKIKTYSIGFNNKKYDESYYSSIVAEHIRSDHKIKYINHHDLLSVLDEFENNFDEPFSDSAAFPTLCISKFARKEVKVVLSGDGSDELFGGYDYYKIIEKIQLILNLPNFLKNLLHHALKIMPFHKLKLLSECIQKNNIIEVYSFMRSVSKDFYKISSDKNNNPFYELFLESYKKMPQKLSPQQYASRLDLLHTLGDGYLQKLDLSSMSFSLEAREPYLDKNVVLFTVINIYKNCRFYPLQSTFEKKKLYKLKKLPLLN